MTLGSGNFPNFDACMWPVSPGFACAEMLEKSQRSNFVQVFYFENAVHTSSNVG